MRPNCVVEKDSFSAVVLFIEEMSISETTTDFKLSTCVARRRNVENVIIVAAINVLVKDRVNVFDLNR